MATCRFRRILDNDLSTIFDLHADGSNAEGLVAIVFLSWEVARCICERDCGNVTKQRRCHRRTGYFRSITIDQKGGSLPARTIANLR